MFEGQIVYYPYQNGFIRYRIKKILDDDLVVLTYKGEIPNCIPINDVLTTEQFAKIYTDEIIYE